MAAEMLLEDREQKADEVSSATRAVSHALQERRRSRPLLYLLMVAVTVFFSYIALKGANLAHAWRALRTSEYVWLVPALLSFGLAMVSRAARWRSLFAPERRPPLAAVGNAMMVGYLYNNILPARAGEVARVVTLRTRAAVPVVETIGTTVLERLYDVFTILIIFFVAKPWLPHVSWLQAAAIAAIVLSIAIVAMVLILAIFDDRAVRFLLTPFHRALRFSSDRLEQALIELLHGLSALRRPRIALAGFFWTALAWMFTALCAYLVTLAFHLHLPFASGVLVAVAVGLAMILPSAPAAVGVFEGAVLIGLKAYSVGHSAALPYALVLHLVNFVPFIVIGLLLLHYNLRHPRPVASTHAGVLSVPGATGDG